MKRKVFALSIVMASLLAISVTASAFSPNVLDGADFEKNINGIQYSETNTTENGDKQKLFYGAYNTAQSGAEYEWVIHSIRDGSVTTLSTVMDIAADYEQATGRKVMLATNGDYFYNTGSNVESYVNNGIVISKGNFASKNCIGFDNNGKVVIGRMTETEKRLVIYDGQGQTQFFEINKYNEQPAEGEIAVYNIPGTYTVSNAGVMIVKSQSENLAQCPVWGSNYTMTETGVTAGKTFTLKSGQYAVVYTAAHDRIFAAHSFGEAVHTVEVPMGQFEGCNWVLGGYDILVNDGVVNTDCHTDNAGASKAPRTLFGFKADGTGFLCVVDGRQTGYSLGITVNQEAQLAAALGAVTALELDGGGSSTMIIRLNDTLTLRNQPSDGAMRRVSNAIMLVEKEKEESTPTEPTENGNPTMPDAPTEPGTTGETDSTGSVSEARENPFLSFFRNLFRAIRQFFTRLFD